MRLIFLIDDEIDSETDDELSEEVDVSKSTGKKDKRKSYFKFELDEGKVRSIHALQIHEIDDTNNNR